MPRLLHLTIVFFFLTRVELLPADKENHVGKPGRGGWRCNIIRADESDDGPDGINFHDWDGDGHLDIFANAEEGQYSRLYFNPGPEKVRQPWSDSIEFKHDQCEDSGIGDLDDDGDIDYIANGGRVYFNPGRDHAREKNRWEEMILFKHERRVPTVYDVDKDGLNDLIVGAQEWFKQPKKGKHDAKNWQKFTIGKNRWPMNCILTDVDGDGDEDMVVPDRGIDICWYENPGADRAHMMWTRRQIHAHTEPMFMAVADVNDDGRKDFLIAGGSRGKHVRQLLALIRTNDRGHPQFKEIAIDQPSGLFPKGIAVVDLNGDSKVEVLVIPKSGDFWTAAVHGKDATIHGNWKTSVIQVPGADSRKKMDNAYVADIDGDGDLDIATTEENGGWGVIWFENPNRSWGL